MRIAAYSDHEVYTIGVGRRLDRARIAGLQDCLRDDYDRATADKIAQQHSEQKRQACRLQYRARPVTPGDVTDLVREHAGELVRRFRFVDEALKYVDASSWQRDGVGIGLAHDGGAEWERQRRRDFELAHQLVECGATGAFALALSALERPAGLAGVEHGSDLSVDSVSEQALDLVGHQRSKPRCGRRHPENRDNDERCGGGKAPEHDLALHAPFRPAAAVDWKG